MDAEAGTEQAAENRRLKAELREARMEIEFLKKRRLSSVQGVPVVARCAFIHHE